MAVAPRRPLFHSSVAANRPIRVVVVVGAVVRVTAVARVCHLVRAKVGRCTLGCLSIGVHGSRMFSYVVVPVPADTAAVKLSRLHKQFRYPN